MKFVWNHKDKGWISCNGKYAIAEREGFYRLSKWELPRGLTLWPPFRDLDDAKNAAERAEAGER